MNLLFVTDSISGIWKKCSVNLKNEGFHCWILQSLSSNSCRKMTPEGRVFFIYACRGHQSCQGCVRGVLVHSAMQPSTQVCLQGQAYGSGKVTDAVDHEGLWKEGVLIKLASLSSALCGPGWNKHWPHLARPSLQPNQQVTIPRLQFQCQLYC